MAIDESSIRKVLRVESEQFKKLEAMHSELDQKLIELSERSTVTPEDEIEEKRLKKMKLRLKDEMYRQIHQYAKAQQGVSTDPSL